MTVAGPGSPDHTVTLRPGRGTDVPAVLTLWVAAGARPTSTDDRSSLMALLGRDPEALLVAEIDGRMAGTLIATWDGWRGSMYRLAVLPDVRRRGIAALLVGQAEARLRALGCRRVQALVVGDDEGAGAFWTAVDYSPDALRRHVHTLSR